MDKYFLTLTLFFTSLMPSLLMAQEDNGTDLPAVFMIGEYELAYEAMVVECSGHLLAVCDDSMDEAYKEWLLMLKDMEDFSNTQSFDIRGIKIWLNIFWNEDGTIRHLVFYPKPNSRNMDFEELRNFFNLFVQQYTFSKKSEACFSHYGSAKFPSFAELYIKSAQN